MLNIARKRAAKPSMNVSFLLADAEALPFSDESFDTVVSSLSTCTFPNPVAALKEMARVCRPQGKVLLLEHGRSDREWLGRWQDRHADQFAKPLGCHWNREPLDLVRQTGLKVYRAKRNFFGIFQQIESLKMAPQPESGELS
jgi:ubiquinone/menaquinone biosynthesis C-methylase UbiE